MVFIRTEGTRGTTVPGRAIKATRLSNRLQPRATRSLRTSLVHSLDQSPVHGGTVNKELLRTVTNTTRAAQQGAWATRFETRREPPSREPGRLALTLARPEASAAARPRPPAPVLRTGAMGQTDPRRSACSAAPPVQYMQTAGFAARTSLLSFERGASSQQEDSSRPRQLECEDRPSRRWPHM